MRLDQQTPKVSISTPKKGLNKIWILTNYRNDGLLPGSDPVFQIDLHTDSGKEQIITFRSGIETSAWNGICSLCSSLYTWTKKISLVGTYSYPDAYQQFASHIWGTQISLDNGETLSSLTITYLLPTGTGFFWGIYPGK